MKVNDSIKALVDDINKTEYVVLKLSVFSQAKKSKKEYQRLVEAFKVIEPMLSDEARQGFMHGLEVAKDFIKK